MDQETVNQARKDADRAYKLYKRAKDLFDRLSADYLHKTRRFKEFDYELAQTDGRLKKIPEHQRQKKKELTLIDVQRIAKILGVNLTEEKEDESKEEDED